MTKTFSPAQLARLLGVSESTIKRWVDSEHLRAEKTAGGHRRIAARDLVAFLRRQGRPVPSLDAIGLLAEPAGAPVVESLTPEALAALLLKGDTDSARALLLEQYRAGRAVDEMLDRLAAPAMAHVGVQWASGRIDVYQEHLATLRLHSILLELRALIPAPSTGAPRALGGAPEGDPYLLPTLMAELTLRELGWRAVNVGPNTPAASFREAIDATAPRLVWISMSSRQARPAFLKEYPGVFERAQARKASVIIGGRALTPALQDTLVASAFGTRLAHLKAFARSLAA